MTAARSTCPDCDTPLQAIKIADATERALGEGVGHVELMYAAHDAEAKWGWYPGIEAVGRITGRLCPRCGRILLYAVSAGK